MVYKIIRFVFKIAIKVFYKKLYVAYNGLQQNKEPTIFIANHPNSFFDAILLGVLLPQPINTLTRGDMFTIKWFKPILEAMKLIPIYRIRDGKDSLQQNDETFNQCITIFNKKGSVLIFGEAKCDGQYFLLPLQKGGIKIAMQAWQTNTIANTLKIVPVAISYSNLKGWRKIGSVIFGTPILKPMPNLLANNIPLKINEIRKHLDGFFNTNLIQHPAINPGEAKRWEMLFEKNIQAKTAYDFVLNVNKDLKSNVNYIPKADIFKNVLTIFYIPLFVFTAWAAKKANTVGKVHYDSILICFCLLFFLLYYLVVFLISFLFFTLPISLIIVAGFIALFLCASKKIVITY